MIKRAATATFEYLYRWWLFPVFYRLARHDGATSRRRAFRNTLLIGYGIRLKRVWRVKSLVKMLQSREKVCPTRSRYWVFRMWLRNV